jgi:hypothetical protein
MEISDTYIGKNQKLPARVIIHRLTDDQTQMYKACDVSLHNGPYRQAKKDTKS